MNSILILSETVYSYKFKIQFWLMILIASINVLVIEFLNHFKAKRIDNYLDIYQLKFNSNHPKSRITQTIFKYLELYFKITFSPFGFFMSFLFMSINFSITYLLTIGMFWSILFGLSIYLLTDSYTWNIIYFLLISYYSRFLLKRENQSLKQMADKKIIRSSNVFTHLQENDLLYQKILSYNEIWPKFILSNWFNLQVLFAILFFFVFLGKHDNLNYKIIFTLGLLIIASFVIIIIIFCSSLSSDAKKTHKYLAKLISSNKLKILPSIRLKV